MSDGQPRDRDPFWWANPTLKQQLVTEPLAVLKDRGIHAPPDLPPAMVHEFIRIVHLLWVDGQIVPLDRFQIDPMDEGLLFGRGAWESTRTIDGTPWLWPLHLERFRLTNQLLKIEVTPERYPDEKTVREYVQGMTSQDVVLRLNASAGRPGKPGLVWMSCSIQPVPATSFRLRTCRSPNARGEVYMTLKTFQYATRLRVNQQATLEGYDSALLVNDDGNLLEAAHANIFLRLRDGWATPASDGGFLPGTVRRHLLDKAPLTIREMTIPQARLAEVREAFVTNSNVGIIPVTQIDSHIYPVGEETMHMIRWIDPKPKGGTQYRFRDRGEVAR